MTTFVYRDNAVGRSHMGLNLAMKDHLTVIQLNVFVLSCLAAIILTPLSFCVYKIRIKLQSLLEDSRIL